MHRGRVLVVRAGALGDLLLLRPTIAALQDAGHAVTLLAPSGPAAGLVGSGPGDVAELLPWESTAFAGLLVEGGVTSAAAAARLGAHHVAVAYTRNGTLARNLGLLVPSVLQHDPAPPPRGPHAAEWLASCLEAIGVHVVGPTPALTPSDADRDRAIGILDELPSAFLALHPGSGSPAKNWPAERFAALARMVAPQRWLLVRGPADDAPADVLARVPGACVARDLPLRVLAAVLARAGAYVGNDSGITHLAAATGAPTIALFGPTDPALWAPIGRRVQVINGGGTMEGIPVEEVAGVIDGLRR